MGIKDLLRSSLKNGLVGLLVGASAIGSFSGLVGCEERYERERQSYSRESQEKLDEDLLVITYDEWKNEDRLKEHAQYILKHPNEAYERLSDEGRKEYLKSIQGYNQEINNLLKDHESKTVYETNRKLFNEKYSVNLPTAKDLTSGREFTKGETILLLYEVLHKFNNFSLDL